MRAWQRNVRLAGVLSLLLLMAGCAATPSLPPPEDRHFPSSQSLQNVPFYAQRDYQCGPASLAMVLNASGVPASVDELIPQVFTPGREGSVQPEMLATVRRHRRISYSLNGTLEALLEELAAGHPVVVLQNLSLPLWPMWHYAVAIGYDLERKELVLHSGEDPNRPVSLRRFDATWARSDRWAMVALPPGELPATADAARATESIAAFEQVAGASAVLPAWQAVVERWPEHAMGWFALGNAEHANGKLEAAAEAFRRVTALRPAWAPGWLNLGLTLDVLDQRDAAKDALRQAVALGGRWQQQATEAMTRLEPATKN